MAAARAAGLIIEELRHRLPHVVGHSGWQMYSGTFRWSNDPTVFDTPGSWVDPGAPGLPDWLRPFNGTVLVGYDNGAVTAGVGRKIHDRNGHELAVVTEEDHRGRGWAKRLVSQAARRVLDEGAIPTYLHAPHNAASARTADAAGFPDRGWRILGLYPGRPG